MGPRPVASEALGRSSRQVGGRAGIRPRRCLGVLLLRPRTSRDRRTEGGEGRIRARGLDPASQRLLLGQPWVRVSGAGGTVRGREVFPEGSLGRIRQPISPQALRTVPETQWESPKGEALSDASIGARSQR